MKHPTGIQLTLLIVITMILASTPYIAGSLMDGSGTTFTGLTWNIDDACVYLSWIRQVADGHILFRNNFTNEPQQGLQFNLLFMLMGSTVRATGLSPTAVFHIFRILLGAGLLLTVFGFARSFIPDLRKRLFFVALLAFSSGFGWFLPENGHKGPIDTWQPEAITFLSLYLNPLFLAGVILMLASFHFLLQARISGKIKPAVIGGVMLLLLANIHSYDVVIVGAVWVGYLLISCLVERKVLWRAVYLSVIAMAIAIPALSYQIYLYITDEVFRLRANTPAPSPAIWSYFLGYGAVFIAALFAIPRALKGKKHLLLVVWVAIGFLLPYLPFAQQRKFVMGLHIPLAILAIMALWPLVSKLSWRSARAVILVFIMFTVIGNVYFVRRDIDWLKDNRTATIHKPFLLDSDLEAMEWLRENTKPDDTVFAPPHIALFVPAISGNNVYYGHWSETPQYELKLREWILFSRPDTPDEMRQAILQHIGSTYVVDTSIPGDETAADLSLSPCLERVYSNRWTSVYRVIPSATNVR